jgi:hypothetical protein
MVHTSRVRSQLTAVVSRKEAKQPPLKPFAGLTRMQRGHEKAGRAQSGFPEGITHHRLARH